MRFWRASPGSQPSSAKPPTRPGLRGTHRLVIVAGLAALLVVSLVSAAFAGVFAGPGRTARTHEGNGTAKPEHSAVRATAGSRRAAKPSGQARTISRVPRTSCTTVAHIGDSTSVGMVSATWLPDPAQRLAAQYADAGVKHVWVDASGGRSIVEEMPGQLNGYRVAENWRNAGFRGCWVFALGTNDTANVFVGSNVGRMARIGEMMSAAHGEPVMWVNAQTALNSGPWSEANMQMWNSDLVRACAAYPNMRVFNWAGMVQPSWHLLDGIHYTSAGYAIRASAIARALATAFPLDGGHSKGCIVN